MTKKEVTEIFSVMMLAWPNSELFKGGIQKLGPTIELWHSCLPDVDFWTGKQAVIRLCRENKYSPTIADFREKVEKINTEIRERTEEALGRIKTGELFGSVADYYNQLPEGDFDKAVIQAMGGPEHLILPLDNGDAMWDVTGFENAYLAVLKKTQIDIGQGRVAMISEKGG